MKIKILTLLMTICLISCSKDERPEVITDPPKIFKFYEEINEVGSNLTIIGENFSRDVENNFIEFGGGVVTNPYSWRKGNRDTLDVIIPEGAETGKIAIEVYSQRAVSKDILFLFRGEFTKMESVPLERRDAVAFSVNGKGYVCTGSASDYFYGDSELNDLWEYNPNTNKWTEKNNFPGEPRSQAFSFVIDGKAYVGGGRNKRDFYRYDSENDTWTESTEFPNTQSYDCAAFSVNNKGYVVGGSSSNSVYEYNPMTDEWNKKNNMAVSALEGAASFVINNIGYVGMADDLPELYEYNSELDTWSTKDRFPLLVGYNPVAFTLGDRGYFANSSGNNGVDCYRFVFGYNPLTDEWQREVDFSGISTGRACSFVIDDKAYIVTGQAEYYTDTNECWSFQAEY